VLNTGIRKAGAGAVGFALVMESDVDLRATICSALLLEGHRVESVADCAGVLSWRKGLGPFPDDLLLALGAGQLDPDWAALRVALDEDAVLSRASVIVLLTIQNGLTFPARARVVQKPFAIEKLMALVASDMKAAQKPV
jgi:DNA-binding response OmpR family regulator